MKSKYFLFIFSGLLFLFGLNSYANINKSAIEIKASNPNDLLVKCIVSLKSNKNLPTNRHLTFNFKYSMFLNVPSFFDNIFIDKNPKKKISPGSNSFKIQKRLDKEYYVIDIPLEKRNKSKKTFNSNRFQGHILHFYNLKYDSRNVATFTLYSDYNQIEEIQRVSLFKKNYNNKDGFLEMIHYKKKNESGNIECSIQLKKQHKLRKGKKRINN